MQALASNVEQDEQHANMDLATYYIVGMLLILLNIGCQSLHSVLPFFLQKDLETIVSKQIPIR